jgi:hypothetical protein
MLNLPKCKSGTSVLPSRTSATPHLHTKTGGEPWLAAGTHFSYNNTPGLQ